ncbi:hypothetical protein M5K25_005848 [Dendrobium thyrsiflorum]|uniref:HAT C-terminal dimerisation domain-containing protein n=1 Tax=Dendrobium thyrsiflorum TaxID=117978 RepID=A0ABD0VAG1_DENTH
MNSADFDSHSSVEFDVPGGEDVGELNAQFGDDVPKLKVFAVKVLSLICLASACECNWNTFNQIHTKKKNRLAAERMNKLVYVMFNKKLKDRHLKLQKQENSDNEIDHLFVDDL